MNKYKYKLIKVVLLASGLLCSCEKENVIQINSNPIEVNNDTTQETILCNVKLNKQISKGFWASERDWIETGTAFFSENNSITYETMKIKRRSDTSKYFYVMTVNADILYPLNTTTGTNPTDDSWYYAYDSTNKTKYGALYTKNAAKKLCNYFYMKLPIYINGKVIRTINTRARLMTKQDLEDMLEMPDNSPDTCSLEDNFNYGENWYYDAFIFGLDENTKEEDAEHSLAGYKDMYSIDTPEYLQNRIITWHLPEFVIKQVYSEGYFAEKNHVGMFWMQEENSSNNNSGILYIEHRHLFNDEVDYKASIKYIPTTDTLNNKMGCSVRLIFEPTYR